MLPDAIEAVLRGRPRILGGHRIRRLLPSRQRSMVGPFIFFDHIGPEALPPGQGVDVPPHPHIDLATVTYLFEGELVHRDSLGSLQTIRPGAINWMHAGIGIAHSERSGPEDRGADSRIHGVQLWVALPREDEETPPAFTHYPESSLPAWDADGVRGRLLVGRAYGHESPVHTRSEALCADLVLAPGAAAALPTAYPELSVYVVEGTVSLDGHALDPSELVIVRPESGAALMSDGTARVLVLGGRPLEGERHIWWNFVSSSPDRIEKAKQDWRANRFPAVPGDETERVPLPE